MVIFVGLLKKIGVITSIIQYELIGKKPRSHKSLYRFNQIHGINHSERNLLAIQTKKTRKSCISNEERVITIDTVKVAIASK